MIAKFIILSLLVAASSSSPVTQDSGVVNYKEAVDMFLDAWKKMLPCGFAPYNIPSMAPLKLDFYPFEYVNGETNLVGNVSNIRISGLNNFEVLSGSFNSSTLHATFDLMYPKLQILGSYEVEGTLSVGGIPLPIRQSVLINKKIIDWRFVAEYTFGQSSTNASGLRIKEFKQQYYVADVQTDNWDKYMDIAANNYMNKLITSFSLLFTEEVQPYVNPMFEKYVIPYANNLLSGMSLAQLTDFFVMQAEVWNSANCNVQA